jgi:outer membrane protein assembly factor BamB
VATLERPLVGPLAADAARLFVSSRERVTAFDRASGLRSWVREGVSGVLAAAGGVLVVRSETGTLTSVDPTSGKTRWTVETGVAGSLPPVIDGSRILVAGSQLTALDVATGKPLFSEPLRHPAVTAPVVAGRCLLLGESDGNLRCRDSQNGRTVWAYLMGQPLAAAPVSDGQRVLVGTGDRRAVSLNLRNGRRQWGFKLGTSVFVPPAVTERYVLIASNESVLYALTKRNGNMTWRASLPSRPLGPPVIRGEQVLVTCHPTEILSFHLATGKPTGTLRAGVPRFDPTEGQSETRGPALMLDGAFFLAVSNPLSILAFEAGPPPAPPELPAAFPPDISNDVPVPVQNP